MHLKFFVIGICLIIQSVAFSKEYTLSICSMFKDEAPYLKEWIEFHRLVGVEHFWLYNNNSSDEYKEVLAPYVKAGVVDLIEWPSTSKQNEWKHHTYEVQVGAFNDALKRAEKLSKWLAIIDLDEFLFSPINDNVAQVLDRHFSKYAGVCVNWQLFGTSHVERLAPLDLMIEKLVMRAETDYPRNYLYKSIVRPSRVRKCYNPHRCTYYEGHYQVNAEGKKIRNDNNGVFLEKLRINHYWTRDEFFLNQVKIPRYLQWNNGAQEVITEAGRLNAVYDDTILRFAKRLRRALQAH